MPREQGGQAQQALRRSRGGFSTKIHALVDALGNPLRFHLTGGNVSDIAAAPELLDSCDVQAQYVLGDKGYDSDEFVGQIERRGSIAVIPSRSNRKKPREYDFHIYCERHLVEVFFNKIKHYRRISSRFEKLARTFLAMIHIASCMIWLR
jgi:transposase